jgi:N-acetylmuramoyl-L-alanine amidase
VVLHYTAMDSAEAALARLCDPLAEVSAHYLIGGDGRLWQMVAEEQRAWHAGAGSWAGQGDINSRSIGIELDNRGTHPFSEPQMAVLEVLLKQILTRWSIDPEGVIAHSDMAPGRKVDPGPRFDWARLASLGLARATPSVSEAAEAGADFTAPNLTSSFISRCAAAGYSAESSPEALLEALRLRYAPMRQGPCCAADMALLQALAC